MYISKIEKDNLPSCDEVLLCAETTTSEQVLSDTMFMVGAFLDQYTLHSAFFCGCFA